jgi:hypothetical protein
MDVLDRLSFDVCVSTPDHFFSLLSTRAQDDVDAREIINRARSALSGDSLSPSLSTQLHSYPSSIVALSLTYTMSPSTFVIDQIKSFVRHKKDATPYFVSRSFALSERDSIRCSLRRHNCCIALLNFKALRRRHRPDDLIGGVSSSRSPPRLFAQQWSLACVFSVYFEFAFYFGSIYFVQNEKKIYSDRST